MTATPRFFKCVARLIILLFILLGGDGFCGEPATGFVGLEEKSGVWWFRSPEGKEFLSIGPNHIEPVYWQSPKNKDFMLEKYGADLFLPEESLHDGLTDEERWPGAAIIVLRPQALNEGSPAVEKWARHIADNFAAWGFNTFGYHNPLSESLHKAAGAYFVVELHLRTPWGWGMTRSTLVHNFKRTPFDVYDDAFGKAVRDNAAKVVKEYAGDPLVLGYAYTDRPAWTVDDDKGRAAGQSLTVAEKTLHPWVLALMSLPAEARGKQAWLATMRERYPIPEKAGATYGLNTSTWDALAATTAWSAIADPVRAEEDSQAFLLKTIRQWYEVRKSAIRAFDQHHLIFGDKLDLDSMRRDPRYPEKMLAILDTIKDSVDLIYFQCYAPFDKQRDALALIYKETGKPLLNGDTACNPLWEDESADKDAYYAKLGSTYADYIKQLFSLPYFVGWHHCGYIRGLRLPYLAALKRGDQNTAGGFEGSKHTHREGFVTEFDEPIDPLVKPLGNAIRECDKLHRDSGTSDIHP